MSSYNYGYLISNPRSLGTKFNEPLNKLKRRKPRLVYEVRRQGKHTFGLEGLSGFGELNV